MNKDAFRKECFEGKEISFRVNEKPVSAQNKGDVKRRFKTKVQEITSQSDFIITGTCWVAIDYYCNNVKRLKNPGVYDIDNIVKPILDSLVGQQGLIIDDVLIDRVSVNWVDTPDEDHVDIVISYPMLAYMPKEDFILVKSSSGWCFPTSKKIYKSEGFESYIRKAFDAWNSIKEEEDFHKIVPNLPIQSFVYFSKVKDKGYEVVEID